MVFNGTTARIPELTAQSRGPVCLDHNEAQATGYVHLLWIASTRLRLARAHMRANLLSLRAFGNHGIYATCVPGCVLPDAERRRETCNGRPHVKSTFSVEPKRGIGPKINQIARRLMQRYLWRQGHP